MPAGGAGSVAPVWTELEARAGGVGLACSWAWTETWLDQFADIVPHEFAVAERDGSPCGAVLLTRGVGRRRGKLPLKTLHVGTAGEPEDDRIYVENNRILALPAEREAVAEALVAAIRADESWDELRLEGFAVDDAELFLRAEPALEARREPCPTVDLRAAAAKDGDVLAILTSNTRYQIRRSLRAFGDVETEWAETPEHALDILDELVALHQQRWRSVGERGAFASERFTAFHRALVRRLVPKRAVVLFRVRSAAQTIGCLYSFVEDGNVYSYQLGLARFDDNKLKPGFVAHGLCMQAAYDRALADYNFLADASPWKRELATTERELVWATASRRRLKLVVADALRTAKRLVAR